jgi:hypothetical protein
MALQIATNMAPSGTGTYYLLEDTYIKGGLQIRDSIAARDLIAIANLKMGQLVLTLEDNKIWKLIDLVVPSRENPDAIEKATWEEFLTGGGGGGGLADAPADGKTYGRQDNGWVEVTSGTGDPQVSKARVVAIKIIDALPIGIPTNFNMPLAASSLVLRLTVNRPFKVSIYGTAARDETNPYQFIATEDHLYDDGTMLLADGSKFRSRNYSILANLDEPISNMLYWTVESVDDLEGPAIITVTYLPLELAEVVEEPTA